MSANEQMEKGGKKIEYYHCTLHTVNNMGQTKFNQPLYDITIDMDKYIHSFNTESKIDNQESRNCEKWGKRKENPIFPAALFNDKSMHENIFGFNKEFCSQITANQNKFHIQHIKCLYV